MHFEESGAFTGEISPVALEDLRCTICYYWTFRTS